MKKRFWIYFVLTLVTPVILMSFLNPPPTGDYVVIGWNDLGMHCANKDFDSIVILPPYNNVKAQAILRGNANQLPQLLDAGYSINYSIPGNTYSVGKTNFWTYDSVLFGVNLPDNIGLAGTGLSGTMVQQMGYFKVDGIPITPYQDTNLITEDPYQLALLQLFGPDDQLLAETFPVVPVSGEINCVSSGCHGSQQDILDRHEDEAGFDPTNLPILCSQCHADVALGMPGIPEAGSLSYVVHDKHAEHTNDCYKCHPGPNTQCFRDVMYQGGMTCQSCHGNMSQVAQSIENGRRPWLDEPSCGSCHGSEYAEEPGTLYRESKGHGGLYCSACHGSPHVIFPSVNPRDNLQNISLQGHAGTLDDCTVCHGVVPQGDGPHGYNPYYLSNDATLSDLQINGMTIAGFDPATLNYTYTVPAGTTTVPTTTATPNDPEASVQITPATSLPGVTYILVTAEDGITTLTYSVSFIFPTVHFTEGFETGVPGSYFSGSLYLSSGTWNGRNVKSSSNHYAGQKSVELKKETTSHLITPIVNGIGSITFYYKGNEDNTSTFKVQRSINNGSWVTLSTVSFKKGNWNQYHFNLNDPSPNQKVRILVTNQKNLLFIDQMTLSVAQTNGPMIPGTNSQQVNTGLNLKSSIGSSEAPEIRIYAHQDVVYLQSLSGEPGQCTVDLIDLSGKIITRHSVNLSEYIKVSFNATPGCYIVHVSSASQTWSEKIIIR
jgi:hypothetical protein